MRVFKHRHFNQWAKSEKLSDAVLKKAVMELEAGLHDGVLGAGLYKKRIAMPGQGKRGGFRSLLAVKQGEHAFFLCGFAKNVRANITPKEKGLYKDLAKFLIVIDEKGLSRMLKDCSLIEVK